MLDSFFNYLTYQKRYSRHTITSYKTDIQQFTEYLEENYGDQSTPENVIYQQVRTWAIKLMESGLANRSINRKMASLRTFYNWLEQEGIREDNPMVKIRSLKTPKVLPKYVGEKEMDQALDEIPYPEGFPGVRDRIVMELLYGTGMRLSELINLKESDVQFASGELKVLGKRNKERIVPMHKALQKKLKSYIADKRRILGPTEENWLIVSNKNEKSYPSLIYSLVKKYLGMVKSPDKRSPHVLRHSFATQLLNNGADINSIKELLGHADLGATQLYTHTTVAQLKKAYDQAHPKSGH